MTKETYFEMCEMLNQEPIESEIPVDPNDLPVLVQQTLTMYNLLEDRWDSMGGGYLGKNYTTVFNFFDLYGIDSSETLLVLELLQHIDVIRSNIVAEKIKTRSPATK
jgi:hypothetical protein